MSRCGARLSPRMPPFCRAPRGKFRIWYQFDSDFGIKNSELGIRIQSLISATSKAPIQSAPIAANAAFLPRGIRYQFDTKFRIWYQTFRIWYQHSEFGISHVEGPDAERVRRRERRLSATRVTSHADGHRDGHEGGHLSASRPASPENSGYRSHQVLEP